MCVHLSNVLLAAHESWGIFSGGPQRLFESPYAHKLLCLILRPVGSHLVTHHAVEAVGIGSGILSEILTDFRMLRTKERLEGYGEVLPNPRSELPRFCSYSCWNPKGA